MKIAKINLGRLISITIFLPLISFAVEQKVINNAQGVLDAITRIGNWIFTIFLAVAVISGVIAAFQFLSAQGNPEKFSEAKRMVIYTAVAVAVAVLSKGLVTVVADIVK